MTFTNPTILVGLAALAIPLAIHLAGRRRPREIVLPTARFADGASGSARGRTWLRRWGLMALRMAAIVCLVAALAGPSFDRPIRDREVSGTPSGHESAAGENTRELTLAARGAGERTGSSEVAAVPPPVYSRGANYGAARAIAVLVVDAADEADARVRSADLVAATFAGDVPAGATVVRRTAADVDRAAIEAADVTFWVGGRPPVSADVLVALAARGGVVWMPADLLPPDRAVAEAVRISAGAATIEKIPDGATIDAGGYASDLLAAFEGVTSGDLGAAVFRSRLTIAAPRAAAVRFHDGAAAIVACYPRARGAEAAAGAGGSIPPATAAGRGNVALAFGPGPAWGDLAGRAEFVVLTHSLAEAMTPQCGVRNAECGVNSAAAPQANPSRDREIAGTSRVREPAAGENTRELTLAARGEGVGGPIDLAAWLVVGLALALAAEGAVAARQSAGMWREGV